LRGFCFLSGDPLIFVLLHGFLNPD
jgi:hypothetical protein